MTSIRDTELLRSRWLRTLERHALDTVDRPDFALGGLATQLREPTVQILLLASDPDADVIDIDDSLWTWMGEQRVVDVLGRAVRFGDQQYPTAHAAALVNGYGANEPWNNYLALHRSGAVECGLGDRGGWERPNRESEPVRRFNLISVVTYTWAMLKFSAAFNERVPLDGPLQLTIALRRTQAAILGNVGEGWAEPGSFENSVGGCVDDHLLWHITLDGTPDDDAQQRIAFSVGNRIEDAWGVKQRRYLARRGERQGQLDTRNIAE